MEKIILGNECISSKNLSAELPEKYNENLKYYESLLN